MSSKKKVQKSEPKPKPEGYTFGRPTKYRPEYCEMLISHMSTGLSFESFAGVVGVWKEAIYEWTKKHPDFSNALKAARSKQRLALEKRALAQAFGQTKGTPATLIFILKNTIGWKDNPEPQDDSYDDLEFNE